MTPIERLEDRLPAALADLAQPLSSDYLPDLLVRTRRVRQRPAWTFPERWIPMTVIPRRASPSTVGGLRVALGLVAALLLALIIAIGMLLATGSAPPAVIVAPRNGLIAYQLDGEIWVTERDATESRLLVSGPSTEYDPWWSRDGSRLMYVVIVDGGELLRTVAPDGTDERTLTEPLKDWTWFDWSPDGRHIAISWDQDGDGTASLGLVATDGSGITELKTGMASTYPMWSPDGSTILFRGVAGDTPGLYTIPASGGAVSEPLVQLASQPSSDAYGARSYQIQDGEWSDYTLLEPSWSPDGTRIAYHTLELVPAAGLDGNGFRVHVMDADGTNDRRIEASAESDDEWGATWAPDGRALGFQTIDADADARNDAGLLEVDVAVATMDGDATAIQRLGPVTYRRTPHEPHWTGVSWAPDSSTVLASEPEVAAMTFDLDTEAPIVLPWQTDGLPSWQPLIGS